MLYPSHPAVGPIPSPRPFPQWLCSQVWVWLLQACRETRPSCSHTPQPTGLVQAAGVTPGSEGARRGNGCWDGPQTHRQEGKQPSASKRGTNSSPAPPKAVPLSPQAADTQHGPCGPPVTSKGSYFRQSLPQTPTRGSVKQVPSLKTACLEAGWRPGLPAQSTPRAPTAHGHHTQGAAAAGLGEGTGPAGDGYRLLAGGA